MEGELSFESMPDWLRKADEIVASGTVDLGGVTRVDSAGVAFLLELTRRAGRTGSELNFVNAGNSLKSLLEFFEIDGVLKLA
ncbi:MAG: STAS domain-containing protein [Panacagrimonas sp.]